MTADPSEFVTREWHNARVVEVTTDMAERMAAMVAERDALADVVGALQSVCAAAEAERDALAAMMRELNRDIAGYKQTVALQYETNDRLTAQLAAAHGLQARAERAEAALVAAEAALDALLHAAEEDPTGMPMVRAMNSAAGVLRTIGRTAALAVPS